jgi:hypothetical protein
MLGIPSRLPRSLLIGLVATWVAIPVDAGEDIGWPREFRTPEGERVVVFQPQLDALEGDRLTGRAAVSVNPSDSDERIFGAVWFDARIETDRDARTVEIVDLVIPQVHFADASGEDEGRLAELLEKEVPKMDLDISMDRVLTSLGVSEVRQAAAEGLNNEPPEIIFSSTPTVLVLFDGAPVLQDIEGAELRYVVNTPFVIVNDPSAGSYYLFAGHDTWYRSNQVIGPWWVAEQVPDEITGLVPVEEEESEAEADSEEPREPPAIIVRTEAAELVVTDGESEFRPFAGGQLLYVSNTDSDVVVEIATQRHFVLLSGRWFAASSLDGPWSFVVPNELPESFLAIEADGEMAHLRASVAGTREADESVLDTQIPQTAAIRRDATIEVDYDGEAQFEAIEGTDLEWAINTETQVLESGNQYFAVEAGAWYTASSPDGPWQVATEVPDAIYKQPATSPTYNTTFVHVYDSTPSVVYVGYHPGYLWSFHPWGCMFWGTGWHHPAWIGHRHFPRHPTWGFHVRWDPFWGWSLGTSWSHGWFSFGMSWSSWGHTSRSAWVGANSWNAGFRAGYQAGRRSQFSRNQNLYDRPRNRARNADVARAGGAGGAAGGMALADQANNVFSDRDGNIYRRNSDGSWQQRQQGQWREASGEVAERAGTQARAAEGSGTRAGQRTAQQNRSGGTTRSLNRESNARQRGSARTQSFNRGGRRSGAARRR